ncbi:MAG: gamma-glutamyl-phosphate reductase, partial [Methylococcaceae bacterium]|nr:gamma-glutamyl-phosphate reductase [Methylococcaceae bacterium]
MSVKQYMLQLGQQARQAGRVLSKIETHQKNLALLKIAEVIANQSQRLIAENQRDLDAAK